MSDAKYFVTANKKGDCDEIELRAQLNCDSKEKEAKGKKRAALKKIIASIIVGKDVSALFPDVVNCMQTDDLELKKLVYLYLMNYAKSQPDVAIMAVNTFVKDCDDPNPLIRALAIRTMGCISLDKIAENLCEPLRKCLKDEDPYVRKTAAMCVAKLFKTDNQMVLNQGFLDQLIDLFSDSNAMVVSNAVAALSEINDSSPSGSNLVEMNPTRASKLLTALNECSEWGQVFILDSLANYNPKNEREAQNICDRITSRLGHANSAVVLSAVKLLMKYMEMIPDAEFVNVLSRKLAPPLVTLLSSVPEVQYVVLRNINLIVQKRPDILKHEMKVFFVKYNDPIYVKLEKLDIMIRLTSPANIAQVLSELKEYATEVDVDFVRKAVRAIGRCAIKLEQSADICVSTLLDLIQTKVNYVVQEATVVFKDIFRKYPNKYESIISTLCENIETLNDPEARASMIWIIGEYAERIDNADELLESFLEGFTDENSQVQLQLLTAIVKLFLKRPSGTQELIQKVLSLSTHSDNPDLRDRGYIYWRLLSTNPAAAKEVVLAEKPLISEETDLLEPTLLDELICHIASLASVYHKPPSAFIEGRVRLRSGLRKVLPVTMRGEGGVEMQTAVIPAQDSLLGDFLNKDINPTTIFSQIPAANTSAVDLLGGGLDSILNIGGAPPQQQQQQPAGQPGLGDIFGLGGSIGAYYSLPKKLWLPAVKGKGLEISGTFSRRNGQIYMDMTFSNKAMTGMTGFAIQFNKNSFGLLPAQTLALPSPLAPNQSAEVSLPLNATGPVQKMDPITNLQVAVKNNVDIMHFACLVPIHVLFVEDGQMDKRVFLQSWKDMPPPDILDSYSSYTSCLTNRNGLLDEMVQKLRQINIFTVARGIVEGHEMLYQSLKTTNNVWVLIEAKVPPNSLYCCVSIRSTSLDVLKTVFDSLGAIRLDLLTIYH